MAAADSQSAFADLAPVAGADPNSAPQAPEAGIGLCLSGGGYRAMLFHLGSLWRLNSAGLLPKLDRISSVSGGSITAGVLAMNWNALQFGSDNVARAFEAQLVDPILGLANKTIDASSILGGILEPGVSISEQVERHYREILFGATTLQQLPDAPLFIFNATNVQTAALWRFSKAFMGDYRVGIVNAPNVLLSKAVTASSAFPPVLSPCELDLTAFQFVPDPNASLQRPPFTSMAVLSDGGVYDNMGMETVWKHYRTVLVSDAGAKIQPEESPHEDWMRHMYRILDVIDNQVRSLRARQVVGSFQLPDDNPLYRSGAFWTIRTNIADYELESTLPCDFAKTTELAHVPTRLAATPQPIQQRLINWGFAVTDAALRAHLDKSIPTAIDFPYPGGVG